MRHEFLDGEIYAMAGGSPDHAALAAALIGILLWTVPTRLPGLHVRPARARFCDFGLSKPIPTLPSSVVERSGPPRIRWRSTNPLLLVEITSPSTEDYDRGEKLPHCNSMPSVREVLIVSHRVPQLTLHRRGDGDWDETTAGVGRSSSSLASVAAQIAVDDLYRDELEDTG